MVTYFTEQDLISFGQYLLSKERTNLIMNHEGFAGREIEALETVYEADIANWANTVMQK